MPGYIDALDTIDRALASYDGPGASAPPDAMPAPGTGSAGPVAGTFSVEEDARPTPGVRFTTPADRPAYQQAVDTIDAALAQPVQAPKPTAASQPQEMPTTSAVHSPIALSQVPDDVSKSADAGLKTGVLSMLGLPGDISKFADWLPSYLAAKGAEKLGMLPPGKTADDFLNDAKTLDAEWKKDETWRLPTSEDLIKLDEHLEGAPLYKPKSVIGDYAKTAAEFVPGAGRNLVTGGLIPALASETAGQATKGTALEPYARIAGGVAGAVAGAAAPHAMTPVKRFAEPLTKAGQGNIAARDLGGATLDIDATRAALDKPAEIVPGSQPTTFQQTGDGGLGQLERKQRNNAETAPVYIERDRAQNSARMDALQGVQPTGAPSDVAARFAQMRDELDRQAQARVDALQPAAQDANAALGGHGTAESTGYALRQPMADARAAAKHQEDELWHAVDPEGTLLAPMSAIKAAGQAVYGNLPKASAANLSAAETTFRNLAAGYGPVEPFAELQGLRSELATAMRDELAVHGRSPAYGRMSRLMGAVHDTINGTVENQVASERQLVARGLLESGNTIDARFRGVLEGFYERQRQARVAFNSGRADGAPADRSASDARVGRTGGGPVEGRGGVGGDQGSAPPPGRGDRQPKVGGSIAYQAPAFGNRTVSARMHAPETAAALGQDVPGTTVRAYGGPLDARMPAGQPGILAFHGSPHDFERFSSAHIGSGEGAQVYGRGLYFAEHEGVARGYRDQLTPRSYQTLNGERLDTAAISPSEKAAARYAAEKGVPLSDDASMHDLINYAQSMAPEHVEGLSSLLEHRREVVQPQGHLYQVRLNRPTDHFLDWDKPAHAQSPYVTERLRKLGAKDLVDNDPVTQTIEALSGDRRWKGDWDEDRAWMHLREIFPKASDAVLQGIADRVQLSLSQGSPVRMNSDHPLGMMLAQAKMLGPEGAQKLRDAGLAGIRYLDEGSRGAGEGTQNFVVFNDGDVHVTHRNGQQLAQPIELPKYLMGQARGAWGEELRGAGVRGDSFSSDLTRRAMTLVKEGRHLDHGVAYENAFINRMPQEDVNAVERGTVSSRGSTAAGAGATRASERGGLGDAGEGRGQSGQGGGGPRESLIPNFNEAAAGRIGAASYATRRRAQTFDEGVAGDILAPGARAGEYKMPVAAVPSAIVPSGKPADAQAVRQFMAAGGSPEALADATAYSIRSVSKRLDGTLDPNKVHTWLAKNREAIAEMPPEVADRFRNVADTQTAVDEMVAKREAKMADFNKTAFGRLAGLRDGDDVAKAVGGILGKPDAVQQFRSLAKVAGTDPAAKEGLRRALVEHMLQKLTTSGSLDASGIPSIKSAAYLAFMRKNGAALREVFSAEEMNMMAGIGADLDRAARTHQTKGLTSGPGTAQDRGAAKGSILGELTKEMGPAGFALASHAAGAGPIVTAASWLGSKTIGRMRAAGLAKADELVLKAMLDPALAKRLLAKVPDHPDRGTAQALGDQFVRISRSTAAGLHASMPDQQASGAVH